MLILNLGLAHLFSTFLFKIIKIKRLGFLIDGYSVRAISRIGGMLELQSKVSLFLLVKSLGFRVIY